MLRLGLIGYGAIGLHVREAMVAGRIEGVELRAALVRRPRAETTTRPDITDDPERFFGYAMDVVVECAGRATTGSAHASAMPTSPSPRPCASSARRIPTCCR